MAIAVAELATYLAAQSIGLTVGTNLFKYQLVPTPDEQCALIPYGGMEPEGKFGGDGVRWEHARIQVVCRAAKDDSVGAMELAENVYSKLANINAESLSGTFYHRAWPLQSPNHLGADASGRPMIGFNVDVTRDLGA